MLESYFIDNYMNMEMSIAWIYERPSHSNRCNWIHRSFCGELSPNSLLFKFNLNGIQLLTPKIIYNFDESHAWIIWVKSFPLCSSFAWTFHKCQWNSICTRITLEIRLRSLINRNIYYYHWLSLYLSISVHL